MSGWGNLTECDLGSTSLKRNRKTRSYSKNPKSPYHLNCWTMKNPTKKRNSKRCHRSVFFSEIWTESQTCGVEKESPIASVFSELFLGLWMYFASKTRRDKWRSPPSSAALRLADDREFPKLILNEIQIKKISMALRYEGCSNTPN